MTRKRYKTWSRSRAMRLRCDVDIGCHPVHVVITTLRRQPILADLELQAAVFGCAAGCPETMTVCIMPDHVHWLLRTGSNLSSSVGRFKSLTTRLAWARGCHGRFWQRSFYDRVIRDRRELRSTIRYILENPRRAGLVEADAEYPFMASPRDFGLIG